MVVWDLAGRSDGRPESCRGVVVGRRADEETSGKVIVEVRMLRIKHDSREYE